MVLQLFKNTVGTAATIAALCLGGFTILPIQTVDAQEKAIYELRGEDARSEIPGAMYIQYDRQTTLPRTVRFAEGEEKTTAEVFDILQGEFRGSTDIGFDLVGRKTDKLGLTHSTYIQTYRDIPFDQTHLILHSKEDLVYAFNGVMRQTQEVKTTSGLDATTALGSAMAFIGAETYKWQVPFWEENLKERTGDPEASYYPEGKLVLAQLPKPKGEFVLAWLFDISSASPDSEVRVTVDANTGAIIYDVPMESNCSAATVNTIFNGSRSISTDNYSGDLFRLRDDCISAEVRIRDWNSATTTASPVEIENNTNTWTTMNEIFGGTVLWLTKRSYAYWNSVHGRASYDDSNGDIEGYINAVFNCGTMCTTTNNASMSFSGGTMKVGLSSAGVLTNSYATMDIIGHEYAHAVTGSTAMLVYEDEWGALNESFSDIFGEAAERFALGSNDWLIGAERDNGAIRSMSNPNAGNDPDTYLGTNWVTIVPPCDGDNDECGVHTNSGVQNFWFYLLVTGGTGTNDNGDDYDVDGIGFNAAEDIAYRNLAVYLGANSSYADARSGSIQASIDLYGLCSPQTEAVMDAWYAVGIGDPFLNVEAEVTSDYNGADVSCFGADDGAAMATASDGLPPYSFEWSNGHNTATATGLSAGSYTVTVTDANNCTETASVTLSNPPMLSATAAGISDYNGYNISCTGACDGSAEAFPAGGVAPYAYQWSASAGSQVTKIATDLCAGEHSVIVKDANGCTTTTETTLTEPPPLEVNAGDNQTIFFYHPDSACTTLTLDGAAGGVPPYTYEWSSGGTGTSEEVCLEIQTDTITTVTYYLTITDANGCTLVDSVDVCYVDIRCGNGNKTKVIICHFPPDNPANFQTLCVSLKALEEHLSHGDHVAWCGFVSPCDEGGMARMNLNDQRALFESVFSDDHILVAYPNPADDATTVRFILLEDIQASVSVFNAEGKLMTTLFNDKALGGEIYDLPLDRKLMPDGIYFIQLRTASGFMLNQKLILH